MGYTMTEYATQYVKKGVVESSVLTHQSRIKTMIAATKIYSQYIDLTNIDDLFYSGYVPGVQNHTLRFVIDGNTTNKTLNNSTETNGEMDVSGVTGEKSVIIYLLNAADNQRVEHLVIQAITTI